MASVTKPYKPVQKDAAKGALFHQIAILNAFHCGTSKFGWYFNGSKWKLKPV